MKEDEVGTVGREKQRDRDSFSLRKEAGSGKETGEVEKEEET